MAGAVVEEVSGETGVGFHCERCGSAEVISVSPGTEPEIAPGGFVVNAGAPVRAWCEAHVPFLRFTQREFAL
jgi:hypothetical protein